MKIQDNEDFSLYDCKRQNFAHFYAIGGVCGQFKGKLTQFKEDRVLFQKLFIEFDECMGDIIDGSEDHVWIFGKDAQLIKQKAKVGDCLSFYGDAYVYKRKDKTFDIGINNIQDVEIIDEYELPSQKELQIQTAQSFVCEICLYNSQCYGLCINDEWRDKMMEAFIDAEASDVKEKVQSHKN